MSKFLIYYRKTVGLKYVKVLLVEQQYYHVLVFRKYKKFNGLEKYLLIGLSKCWKLYILREVFT